MRINTRSRTGISISLVILLVQFSSILLLQFNTTFTAKAAFDPACPWMDTTKSPDERAGLLLAASTLDQKLRWLDEQAAANPTQTTFSGGVTYPVQVACTPVIQYTDGPESVTGTTGVTAFPSQTALAATWNADLSRQKGAAQAEEAFDKHRNVLLAPGLSSGRTPLLGRTAEYMGEDPLLGGTLAGTMIQGIQLGNPDKPVMATLKHWVANEQELDRQTSSSNIDARTLHETYNLPFEVAIKTGNPGGIMCSFNQVNGIYSCENPTTLRQYLKNEIGFNGYVVSDFGSVHSTAQSLIAGLDQELNRPRFYSPVNIKAALDSGQLDIKYVDEAAFRVVRSFIAAGLFDHPLPAVPVADASTSEHQSVALKVAEEGSVLLKNQDQILPLSGSGKKIAVIGPTASNTVTAFPAPVGNLSASSVCTYNNGGSCPNPVAPLDAITARAAQDGNTVSFNNGSDLVSAAAAAQTADVAIVFGYYREGEFSDRPNISLDNNGDALISAVAAANPNTVVILQTGGPVVMPWLNQVKGVVEVWYAGQEMGNAISALLWGDVNFSGKLPMTFPKALSDTPTGGGEKPAQYPGIFTETGTTTPPSPRNGAIRQVDYSEGLKVGYKWYDSQGIEPLFPFGFGLSYTTFEYSHLQVTPDHVQSDKEIRVRVRVTNTGTRAGTEVAQVYLGLPGTTGEPPKRLVGWANVTLNPGEFKNVEITINPGAADHPLSYWDTGTNSWVIAGGSYTVFAGTSSRNLLTDKVEVRVVKDKN